MTQFPTQQPAVQQVKPQPNIYTVLIIVAVLALATAIVLVLKNLMSSPGADGSGGYGLSFGELFDPLKNLLGGGK